MKKLFTFLIIGAVLCGSVFAQAQSNDAYPTGWLSRSIRGGGGSAFTMNQNLNTTDSPSFSNLTASPTLSAEQLTNVAGWTAAGNWTYAGGKWSHATGSATALTATGETAIAIGTKYEIVMTITTSTAGGGLSVSLGGQSFAAVSTGAPTTYTYNVTALSTAALAITPTSGTWVGDITAISAKIVTDGVLIADGIILNSGSMLFPDSNLSYPSLAFGSGTTGLYFSNASNTLSIAVSGVLRLGISSNGCVLPNGDSFGWNNFDLRLSRDAAATLQLGADAAAPIDQTLKAADGVGTDKPGAMLTLSGGYSTGAGQPGGVRVQTSTIAGTGSTANTYYDRIRAVGKVYSLTNNSATALFSIACTDGAGVGGKVDYTVEVTDGTDIQVESGTVQFAGVNKATETWTTGISEVSQPALSSGTLATTWAIDTATADTLKVTLNSNSSLTPTSTLVRIIITLNSPKVITIL